MINRIPQINSLLEKNKAIIPKEWREAYPDASYNVITSNSYHEFVKTP